MVGLAGYLGGLEVVGAVATGFALAAALLNAAFGFCLGCEIYLRIRRVTSARSTTGTTYDGTTDTTPAHAAPTVADAAVNPKEEEALA